MGSRIVSPKPDATFAERKPLVLCDGDISPDFGIAEFDDGCWRSDWD
jgi:hypothetical protein